MSSSQIRPAPSKTFPLEFHLLFYYTKCIVNCIIFSDPIYFDFDKFNLMCKNEWALCASNLNKVRNTAKDFSNDVCYIYICIGFNRN